MELPKNVTQIGEANKSCKIYVEDYVISYMKQMNKEAHNKEIAVALYGTKKQDGEISYLFLYGACKLNLLQKGIRHLSQAQQQEIEKLRKKYFGNYEFRGYCLLNGEMVEGVYIFEQGICRYITGYAQFYEKNDSMLAYMLDSRQEEAQPEVVEHEKYDMVKRRQEERRAKSGEKKAPPEAKQKPNPSPSASTSNVNYMKASAVAVFALLCMTGVAAVGDGETKEDIEQAIAKFMEGITEQKLPDAAEVMNTNAQVSTLVTEDKLSEALQKENSVQTPEQQISLQDNYLNNLEVSAEQELQQNTPVSDSQAQTQNTETSNNPTQLQNTEASNNQTQAQNTGASDNQTQNTEASNNQTQLQNTEASNNPTQPQNTEASDNQTQPQNTETSNNQTQPQNTETSSNQPQNQVSESTSNISLESLPYVVQKGDTLTAISIRNYGTDRRVTDICNLNKILNPDDIKEGQKILLP